MVRKMIIGAIALVALMASPAAAQYPDIVVNPGAVVPGGTVTVTGTACAPGDTVEITMVEGAVARAPGDVIVTLTVTADENGDFIATFTVPAGTALGAYTVTATCVQSGITRSQTVNVVAATVTPPGPGGGSGGGSGSGSGGGSGALPRTGSDLNTIGLVGAGLLAAGGLLLVATKRRRHQGGLAA